MLRRPRGERCVTKPARLPAASAVKARGREKAAPEQRQRCRLGNRGYRRSGEHVESVSAGGVGAVRFDAAREIRNVAEETGAVIRSTGEIDKAVAESGPGTDGGIGNELAVGKQHGVGAGGEIVEAERDIATCGAAEIGDGIGRRAAGSVVREVERSAVDEQG